MRFETGATVITTGYFPKDADQGVCQKETLSHARENMAREFPGQKWEYYPPFPDDPRRLCGTPDGVFLLCSVVMKRKIEGGKL